MQWQKTFEQRYSDDNGDKRYFCWWWVGFIWLYYDDKDRRDKYLLFLCLLLFQQACHCHTQHNSSTYSILDTCLSTPVLYLMACPFHATHNKKHTCKQPLSSSLPSFFSLEHFSSVQQKIAKCQKVLWRVYYLNLA